MRGFESYRAIANALRLTCAFGGAATLAACATIPAVRATARAETALDTEFARHLRDPARAADRTYNLTLAAALLDKAREQAAKGRFESARALADEAARLARHASVGDGGSGA